MKIKRRKLLYADAIRWGNRVLKEYPLTEKQKQHADFIYFMTFGKWEINNNLNI